MCAKKKNAVRRHDTNIAFLNGSIMWGIDFSFGSSVVNLFYFAIRKKVRVLQPKQLSMCLWNSDPGFPFSHLLPNPPPSAPSTPLHPKSPTPPPPALLHPKPPLLPPLSKKPLPHSPHWEFSGNFWRPRPLGPVYVLVETANVSIVWLESVEIIPLN